MTQDSPRTKNRFMMEMGHVIREVNHKVITAAIPELSIDAVMPLVMTVAERRAEYLSFALELSKDMSERHPSVSELQRLKLLRETYEEIVAAAKELEHCVDRGYIDLVGAGDESQN